MSSRSHPVRQALDAAAAGYPPTSAELDELKLPASARRKLADTAREAAALKKAGEMGEASHLAGQTASEIVAALPEAQQSDDYLKPPVQIPDDPASLAAMVRRTW